ncbi:aldo/keto reductase [Streptomyces sp. JV176]|nr:aldo/keto reductase [Streptomyces sp. JV176]MEE1797678.1 aldo/keto reductase [Streptomyces sp. JV176]
MLAALGGDFAGVDGRSVGSSVGPGDWRSFDPRFAGGSVDYNLTLVEAVRQTAQAKGCAVAQMAIAWVAAQADDIVPVVGARTHNRSAQALAAKLRARPTISRRTPHRGRVAAFRHRS